MQKHLLRRGLAILLTAFCVTNSAAFEIVVDYQYDTQDFFADPVRRDALEAAAARYSRVITSSLLPVAPNARTGWRVQFEHPGTGETYQLSTATNASSDPVPSDGPADEYGFPGLAADEWILYAGGRSLPSAGKGGTGTGFNFTSVFDDLNSHLHRGVISNNPDNSINDLPAWGGAVTFDVNADWHFDMNSTSTGTNIDFYTIALHEIGHVLGLGTTWNQWQQYISGSSFAGPNAVAAYNTDNNANVSSLSLNGGNDPHWEDGQNQSRIFAAGDPVTLGTVGNELQDLLLEPIANFSQAVKRFEITNVDASSLVDVGWSILDPIEVNVNPLDLNSDTLVNVADVDIACSGANDIQPWLSELGSVRADLDFDGTVGFSDFLIISRNFNSNATYSNGDIDCDGAVEFSDFLALSRNFGNGVTAVQNVPEPSGTQYVLLTLVAGCLLRQRRR